MYEKPFLLPSFGFFPCILAVREMASYTINNWLKVYTSWALARWLSWLEHCLMHQKVAGLIPGRSTYLGCGFHPRWGHIWEATNDISHINVSLSLYFSTPLKNKSILLKKKTYPWVRIFLKNLSGWCGSVD